jgi:hypothetical protein
MTTPAPSDGFAIERLADAPDPLLRLWWYSSKACDLKPGQYGDGHQALMREIVWRFLEEGLGS